MILINDQSSSSYWEEFTHDERFILDKILNQVYSSKQHIPGEKGYGDIHFCSEGGMQWTANIVYYQDQKKVSRGNLVIRVVSIFKRIANYSSVQLN